FGFFFIFNDWCQRQLATVINLGDLHLQLLANADDVFNVLNALATVDLAQLGDVQQTILARGQRNERTEGGQLHDGTQVTLADLRNLRVGDGVDGRTGSFSGLAVGCADQHGAVIFDRDVSAGVFLDLVDHLALRADDLTDLIHRNLHGDDSWSVDVQLVRSVDSLVQNVQDVQTCFASLGQRGSQYRSWNAIQLGIQLDRGHELGGTCNLE